MLKDHDDEEKDAEDKDHYLRRPLLLHHPLLLHPRHLLLHLLASLPPKRKEPLNILKSVEK
jgi:hypothetical protein